MKRIITCSDGTWNKPNEKDDGVVSPTNICKLYNLISLRDSDGIEQVSFYDEGVGTDLYN